MDSEWAAMLFFPHGAMVLITGGLAALAVGVHYEALSFVSRAVLSRLPRRARPRIMALVLAVLLIHVLEIWLFGMTYFWALRVPAFGGLQAVEAGMAMDSLPDYTYFSAMVYTTVGFGDIVPDGPVRLLVGAEAITGLVLITWTASYTYLEMQRYWGE